MPTQKKIETVAGLQDRLERASIVVSAAYRGLTVKEADELRRRLRAGGMEVKVIKNSLLRLAALGAGQPDLMSLVEGPTVLAFSYGDSVEAAKAVTDYAQDAPSALAVRGALMEGRVVSPEDLRELVRLPSKPIMLANILGQLQSPLAGFLGLLESPLQEFSGLLQSALSELPGLMEARAKQLEASQ